MQPLESPPQPAPGLAPILTCLQPSNIAAALPAGTGPGDPLPATAASAERLPSSPRALQGSSSSSADSLSILSPLLAAALLAAAAPLQGSSSVLACQRHLCLPCREEKLHVGLFCCLSPSLTEAVPLQLSWINRH